MTKSWQVVIVFLLIVILLAGLLILLGWDKSTSDSSAAGKPIVDYIVDGWEILFSPRDDQYVHQPTAAKDIGSIQCAYQWATQPLPEESLEILDAFRESGYTEVSVSAEAFGENCIHPETGQVIKFLTMQTDIYINSQVESIEDKEAIGNKLAEYLLVLEGIPGKFPGPQPGQIRVTYIDPDNEFSVWFPYQQGLQSVRDGLMGGDLLKTLGY